MPYNKYAINNLAQWTVWTTLTAWSTTLVLWASQGALFPSTFPFILKLEWFTTWNVVRREIVKCTNRTSDTLTIVRSFETCPANYTALTQTSTAFQFEVWDVVSLVISKEWIVDIQNEVTRLESDKLNLSWWQMTWLLKWAKGTTIASASSITLANATWNYVEISGTTTITSFGANTAWNMVFVKTQWALILTHNATSLILPTWANILTSAWDSFIAVWEGSSNWKVINYQRADWSSLYWYEVFELYYWDWSDWDITISSWTTTLTRDMQYNNLTINSPWILNTNWFRVFIKWILSWTGNIRSNWNNWWNWSSSTWWTGWTILNQWNLWLVYAWISWANWVTSAWNWNNTTWNIIDESFLNWVNTWKGGDWWNATTATWWNAWSNTVYRGILYNKNILENNKFVWLWYTTLYKYNQVGGWIWWASWWMNCNWSSWGGWWGWGSWWQILLYVNSYSFSWNVSAVWWSWWVAWISSATANYAYTTWWSWWGGWGSWWNIYIISWTFNNLWTISVIWWNGGNWWNAVVFSWWNAAQGWDWWNGWAWWNVILWYKILSALWTILLSWWSGWILWNGVNGWGNWTTWTTWITGQTIQNSI